MFRMCSVFALACVLLVGCAHKHHDPSEDSIKKWNNIQRLMFNEPHLYTVWVQDDPKKPELNLLTIHCSTPKENEFGCSRATPKFIMDVPEGQAMWAQAREKLSTRCKDQHWFYYDVEIHIRSPKDIEGGGWEKREGKTTRKGQNSPIE